MSSIKSRQLGLERVIIYELMITSILADEYLSLYYYYYYNE